MAVAAVEGICISGLICSIFWFILSKLSHSSPTEREVVTDSLPVDLIGMSGGIMSQYIVFVADRLMYAPGHQEPYCVKNAFERMEMISLQGVGVRSHLPTATSNDHFRQGERRHRLPGVKSPYSARQTPRKRTRPGLNSGCVLETRRG